MHFKFSYNKKQIIQGLRYHFISRREIKLMMILVNVFAIGSAVLFYTKKINEHRTEQKINFVTSFCHFVFIRLYLNDNLKTI